MLKESFAGKGAALIGASVVFCGLTLYGAGKLLDYLFRDVNPKYKEAEAKDDVDVIETEEPIPEEPIPEDSISEEPIADPT